ncbi:MAG: MarR family winged helix-turn-helix transcriptional regulator [Microthrixaceae bacterium]
MTRRSNPPKGDPADPDDPRQPLADSDYRALADFRHALRVFLRFSEEAARDERLTPNQHQLLLAIRASEEPPPVALLAERLQLRPHSTLELLRRAESAGLVEMHADEMDHRRQLAYLTDLGADRLERLTKLHRDELRRFRTQAGDLLNSLD